MQLCDIFIFNFKTQLAIICVFHFINCFPFLFPNELTKYQSTYITGRIYYFYSKFISINVFNIKFIPNTTIYTFVFLKKKSLFHFGTGADILPQKRSQKMTGE